MFWFFSKPKRHILTDDDRERAAEINRERFELQRLKVQKEKDILQLEQRKRELQIQRDLAKLEAEINEYSDDGDDETDNSGDGADKMLLTLLSSAMLSGKQAGNNNNSSGFSTTSPEQPEQPLLLSLSDEQIEQYWQALPAMARKMGKTLSDEQIKALVVSKIGNVEGETLRRIINRVRAP